MLTIRKHAFARAGLIGNPSDGYHGRTIALAVPNFSARVVLYEWDEVEIVPSQNDHSRFRSVEALAREGDLLFLHSTSGDSENLLRAVATARSSRVHTVALLARGGGRLRQEVDLALVIPTETVARAQELHLAIGHAICERVDRYFAEER